MPRDVHEIRGDDVEPEAKVHKPARIFPGRPAVRLELEGPLDPVGTVWPCPALSNDAIAGWHLSVGRGRPAANQDDQDHREEDPPHGQDTRPFTLFCKAVS